MTQRTCGSCCCPLAGAHKKPAVRNTSVVRKWWLWLFIFYEVMYPVSRRLPLLELCLDEGRLGKGNKCDEDGSCMKKRFPLFGFVRGQMSHPTDWSFPVALCLDKGRLGKGNKCNEDGSSMKKTFPTFWIRSWTDE